MESLKNCINRSEQSSRSLCVCLPGGPVGIWPWSCSALNSSYVLLWKWIMWSDCKQGAFAVCCSLPPCPGSNADIGLQIMCSPVSPLSPPFSCPPHPSSLSSLVLHSFPPSLPSPFLHVLFLLPSLRSTDISTKCLLWSKVQWQVLLRQ